MINYLSEEEIIEINKYSLKATDEIVKMMNSKYGKETSKWLKNNYKKK